MILISLGRGGGRSGEMARSSGIRENVEEKDLLRAVKGGAWWWAHLGLTRGEKTSSELERARRLYSDAQAGITAVLMRARTRRAYKRLRYLATPPAPAPLPPSSLHPINFT